MSQLATLATFSYNENLKNIKRNLGTRCLFLSNHIKADKTRSVKVVLLNTDKTKNTYFFDVPHDLTVFTKQDYEYLEEFITSKFK